MDKKKSYYGLFLRRQSVYKRKSSLPKKANLLFCFDALSYLYSWKRGCGLFKYFGNTPKTVNKRFYVYVYVYDHLCETLVTKKIMLSVCLIVNINGTVFGETLSRSSNVNVFFMIFLSVVVLLHLYYNMYNTIAVSWICFRFFCGFQVLSALPFLF